MKKTLCIMAIMSGLLYGGTVYANAQHQTNHNRIITNNTSKEVNSNDDYNHNTYYPCGVANCHEQGYHIHENYEIEYRNYTHHTHNSEGNTHHRSYRGHH